MIKPCVVVIGGPTASGKTKLAISVAETFDAAIISADSRQFYREMNIGTAKPDKTELNKVKHYFVNNLSISESYSVGDFEKEALLLLEQYFKTKKLIFLVGGSGLYINALIKGFDDLPESNADVRKMLNNDFNIKGLSYLQNELSACDPDYFKEVDINNPQRIIRALEVCRTTGRPFSSYRLKSARPRSFNVIKTAIGMDRELLYGRINLRVDKMMSEGLLEEVKTLREFKNHNALQTVGYKELFSFLDGNITLKEAVELIKRNTRRYAKRQLTWFKQDLETTWFTNDQTELIEAHIRQILSKKHLD